MYELNIDNEEEFPGEKRYNVKITFEWGVMNTHAEDALMNMQDRLEEMFEENRLNPRTSVLWSSPEWSFEVEQKDEEDEEVLKRLMMQKIKTSASLMNKNKHYEKRKKEIALDFVSLHRDTDWENWVDVNDLEDIYNFLIRGVYGGEIDENGFINSLEIDRFQSKTGNPIIFEIEDEDINL